MDLLCAPDLRHPSRGRGRASESIRIGHLAVQSKSCLQEIRNDGQGKSTTRMSNRPPVLCGRRDAQTPDRDVGTLFSSQHRLLSSEHTRMEAFYHTQSNIGDILKSLFYRDQQRREMACGESLLSPVQHVPPRRKNIPEAFSTDLSSVVPTKDLSEMSMGTSMSFEQKFQRS